MTLRIWTGSTIGIIILFFSLTVTSVPLLLISSDSFSISASESFFNKTESNLSNTTNRAVDDNNNDLLSLKILSDSLENRLDGAASMLEYAASLSEMRSMPNASLLNTTLETLHGIPPDSDIPKRIIAQKVVSFYPEIA